MPPALVSLLPAILAALTDLAATAIVRSNQQDLPSRFVLFQVVMLAAALLIAIPSRWVRALAFALLVGGALLGAASVGFLYAPTILAAGWVLLRRQEIHTPSYLDAQPQKGILYTESELEAMRKRESPENAR